MTTMFTKTHCVVLHLHCPYCFTGFLVERRLSKSHPSHISFLIEKKSRQKKKKKKKKKKLNQKKKKKETGKKKEKQTTTNCCG